MGKNLCSLLEPCASGYGLKCCKECSNLDKCIKNDITICENANSECIECHTSSSKQYDFLNKLSDIVLKVQNENIDKIEIGEVENNDNSYYVYLLKDGNCLYVETIECKDGLENLVETLSIPLKQTQNKDFIIEKALPNNFNIFEKIVSNYSKNCKALPFKKGLHQLEDGDYTIQKFKIERIDKSSNWDIPFEKLLEAGFIPRNIDYSNDTDIIYLTKKHKKEIFSII